MQFTPCLYFKGNCEAALQFYAACGLGTTRKLRRYQGSPIEGHEGEAWRDVFEGPWLRLYASDGSGSEPVKGCAL